MIVSAKITIKGLVQGVGYRWFADRAARKNNLHGFVENKSDGTVYSEVEGDEDLVKAYIKDLRMGPRGSQVEDVEIVWQKPHHLFINFKIKA